MPRHADTAPAALPRWATAFQEGLACAARGMLERAAACFEQAALQNPSLAEAWRNLGSVRARQNRHEEAERCLRKAIALRAGFAEAYNDLGCALGAQGKSSEALDCFLRAIELNPGLAEAHFNRARALHGLRRFEEAVAAYRAAIALQPEWAEAHALAACALAALRRFREAAESARRALALNPGLSEAHNALGVALEAQGDLDAALASYEAALRLNPAFAEALSNRGNALARMGRLSEAEQDYRRALALQPAYAIAWNNLAHVLERQGAVSEAVACYRRAIGHAPGFALAHSNLLLALHYLPELVREALYAEHRQWARRHAPALLASRSYGNEPDPERPLRVGYLSPDFRAHSVAFFIEPVLACHDRRRFRVICYSNVLRGDAVTRRLKELADEWVDIHELGDEEAAVGIRDHRVDILVDLAGHTANGRTGVVARKPAPVVVNWLGYPDTTGMDAVDYRITDDVADPPGEADRYHSERLVRLPAPFLCYRPPAEAPPVGPLPATRTGAVTFAAFHNLAKINARVAEAWSVIMQRVASARLMVKTAALGDEGARQRLARLLAEAGVPLDRVRMRGHAPSLAEHLAAYGEVDIALDTFPYSGTTTTCEALWMGVPVITLAGQAHVSRTGLSILRAAELGDLAAGSVDEYVERAVALASDRARLEELRGGMRQRLEASRLMRSEEFVRDLEAAYREMWRRWCDRSSR
ncbi:MAG: tetratricopeptide repeat protein [Bryobacteraceae bacterium]